MLGLCGGLLLGPRIASACGGLFCNARPPDPFAPLPVAQNGENVVFAITPDPAGGAPTLTAHIQILYTGDAAKFSWVVPVDAAPVLTVGTDRLFSALGTATQPQFQVNQIVDGTCIPPTYYPPSGSFGSGGSSAAGAGGRAGGGPSNGGVTVSFQGAVGPFDAAVIMSDDAMALKTWLTTNGYIVSDAASGLIDAYVQEHKFFVALKLLNGVGVQSIQPIVLTFKGTEPCVPLRLTAIAANPDMPVLVWILGKNRVVPKAFYEVKIDEARIDWTSAGSNYFGPKGLVSLAANEAGGNAFVTEYAGSSSIARATVYANGQVDLSQLSAAMTPPVYVQLLISMGLSNDAQMLPLLQKYIPMPQALADMGITPSQFYANLSLYWAQYAFPPYDLAMLTTAINTTIVMPRQNAQMMIDGHPYLTRLNTFISPEEMNKDPLFLVNADLPDVSNVHTAVLRTMCGNMQFMACNAPVRLELSDGRMAWVRAGMAGTTCQYRPYDVSHLMTLPAAESAWDRDTTGEGTRVVDQSSMIAAGLALNNNAFPAEQSMFPIASTGAGGGSATGGGAAGGMTGSGGTGGKATGGIAGNNPIGTGGGAGGGGKTGVTGSGGSGCSCTMTGEAGDKHGAWIGGLSFALSFLFMRRRRRPCSSVIES